MHSFKIALLAVAASLVRAQDLSQIPSCALGPAVAALGSTGCSETDFKCICSASSFITSLTPAVTAACDASDLAKAEAFAVSLCASVGITLNLGGSTTSAAPPASVTYSSSPAPASSSPASSYPAAQTTAAGVSTVYVTVPCSTSVYSSAAATTPVATKSSNVTVTAVKSSTPSVFTGAAAAGYVSSVTLFGGVAAVLGALML